MATARVRAALAALVLASAALPLATGGPGVARAVGIAQGIHSAGLARNGRVRGPICRPTREEIQARAGASVLFLRTTGPYDGKYGSPSALFGCTRLHQRPVRISAFDEFTGPTFYEKSINRSYAAFVEEDINLTCGAYEPGQECEPAGLFFESVDLRSGHVRAARTNGEPSALVLTNRGWIAWVAGTGSRSKGALFAHDSAGQRRLDPGPVNGSSLHANGNAIDWTSATGVASTATLR